MVPTIHCREEPGNIKPRSTNDTGSTAAWAWVEVETRVVSVAGAQDKGDQRDFDTCKDTWKA